MTKSCALAILPGLFVPGVGRGADVVPIVGVTLASRDVAAVEPPLRRSNIPVLAPIERPTGLDTEPGPRVIVSAPPSHGLRIEFRGVQTHH